MDDFPDTELNALLCSYQVDELDPKFIDKMVVRVEEIKSSQLKKTAMHYWARNAAMMTAAAVLGFSVGNASLPKEVATNSSSQSYLNRLILGPDKMIEITL